MKKTLCFTILVLFLLFSMVATGYCSSRNNWGNTDTYPLLGREIPYDLIYRGADRGGVSTIVSQVSKLTTTNLAFSLLKLSGATKTFSIEEGVIGQEITLVKSEYDARVLTLDLTIDNPNTAHTGFSSITWPTAAGSFVTLAWIDDTNGWIITGSNGVTIAY